MKHKTWKKIRNFERGVIINQNGTFTQFGSDKTISNNAMVPVIWFDKICMMAFYDFPESFGVNSLATQLLSRSGIVVYGNARIVTEIGKKFKMRVWASRDVIKRGIEHLGLNAEPFIDDSFYSKFCDIYSDSQDDLVLIRMAL